MDIFMVSHKRLHLIPCILPELLPAGVSDHRVSFCFKPVYIIVRITSQVPFLRWDIDEQMAAVPLVCRAFPRQNFIVIHIQLYIFRVSVIVYDMTDGGYSGYSA